MTGRKASLFKKPARGTGALSATPDEEECESRSYPSENCLGNSATEEHFSRTRSLTLPSWPLDSTAAQTKQHTLERTQSFLSLACAVEICHLRRPFDLSRSRAKTASYQERLQGRLSCRRASDSLSPSADEHKTTSRWSLYLR